MQASSPNDSTFAPSRLLVRINAREHATVVIERFGTARRSVVVWKFGPSPVDWRRVLPFMCSLRQSRPISSCDGSREGDQDSSWTNTKEGRVPTVPCDGSWTSTAEDKTILYHLPLDLIGWEFRLSTIGWRTGDTGR